MTPDERAEMRLTFQGVAANHGLDEADLYVRDMRPAYVSARWEAWSICHDAGYSYPVIAALGGWDHSSVMHGVNRHGKASAPLMFRTRRT